LYYFPIELLTAKLRACAVGTW